MGLKEEIENRLSPEEILRIYEEHMGKSLLIGGGQYKFVCPFHADKGPSLVTTPARNGVYHCFACGAKGNIYSYILQAGISKTPLKWLAERFNIDASVSNNTSPVKPKQIQASQESPAKPKQKMTVPSADVLKAHSNIMNMPDKIQELGVFGLTTDIIKKRLIGFNNGRFYFPIPDEIGDFVNIRMYDPNNKDMKVISYGKGFGEARLYPVENLRADTIYIMEGEKDCLVAESYGYNAITVTGGATSWNKKWNELFVNKNIIIVGDIDQAGIEGANKKARELYPIAGQVKIVKLPIDASVIPNGDFTDYMSKCGGTVDLFNKIVEETPVFSPDGQDSEKEVRCLLADASKSTLIGKKCHMSNIMINGRDRSPFSVPKDVVFTCKKYDEEKCGACEIAAGVFNMRISKTDPVILQLVQVHSRYINSILKNAANQKCKHIDVEIKSNYTVDKIMLSPNTTYNIEEKFEYVNRIGFYISEAGDAKVETNKCYDMRGVTLPEPNTQQLVHLIYWISQSDTDIDSFKLTPEIEESLSAFRVETTIGDKLKDIYGEFSKMCRIYGREDLMLLYDLAFHSAISFHFQGQSIGKGWVESCVVGDSGSAKTSTVKFLIKHYHAGEILDGESCTEAGLKGGLQQGFGGKSWQLQWGRIPINDRRLVVLDEASGIELETIANLSNIRSSGECIIQKIVSDKTRSRTRLIWIANPRKNNTTISNYTFGVDTVRDFFGKPEDVRRCDVATTAATGEIPISVINKKHEDIVPRYTSELCSLLIRFAWSRSAEDILILPDAEDLILTRSTEIGEKYSPVIPLVEAADMRNKIARLAVSLAIRVFNVRNGIVIVEKDHVNFACDWLNKIYAKPMFRYDAFSEKELRKVRLENPEMVAEILRLKPDMATGWTKYDALGTINDLLDYSIIDSKVLAMIMGVDIRDKEFGVKLLKLKRSNAITLFKSNDVKINPALIDFLRKSQAELLAGDEPKQEVLEW